MAGWTKPRWVWGPDRVSLARLLPCFVFWLLQHRQGKLIGNYRMHGVLCTTYLVASHSIISIYAPAGPRIDQRFRSGAQGKPGHAPATPLLLPLLLPLSLSLPPLLSTHWKNYFPARTMLSAESGTCGTSATSVLQTRWGLWGAWSRWGIGPGFRLWGILGTVRAWHPIPTCVGWGGDLLFLPVLFGPWALARGRAMEMAVLQAAIVSDQLYHAPGRSWESPSLRTAAAGDGIGWDGMG